MTINFCSHSTTIQRHRAHQRLCPWSLLHISIPWLASVHMRNASPCFATSTPFVPGVSSHVLLGSTRAIKLCDAAVAKGNRRSPLTSRGAAKLVGVSMSMAPTVPVLGLAALGVAAFLAIVALRKRISETFTLLLKATRQKGSTNNGQVSELHDVNETKNADKQESNTEGNGENVEPGYATVAELDDIRDRAIASIEAEPLSIEKMKTLSDDDYQKLTPSQKREMLIFAFKETRQKIARGEMNDTDIYDFNGESKRPPDSWLRNDVPRPMTAESIRMVGVPGYNKYGRRISNRGGRGVRWTGNSEKSRETNKGSSGKDGTHQLSLFGRFRQKYMLVAESINGRAAALGFVLCLAREVFEPGHPSLFDQVEDVLVPIAQHTPPFVVAMCDKLVDLVF